MRKVVTTYINPDMDGISLMYAYTTKMLFKVLQENRKIHIDNIDITATTFAMTIHSLIDYEFDCKKVNKKFDKKMIQDYIDWFCNQYSKE